MLFLFFFCLLLDEDLGTVYMVQKIFPFPLVFDICSPGLFAEGYLFVSCHCRERVIPICDFHCCVKTFPMTIIAVWTNCLEAKCNCVSRDILKTIMD